MTTPGALDVALLDTDGVGTFFEALRLFVAELRADDIEVPACWYVHGWTVHRLSALLRWQRDLSVPPTSGRAVAEWWTSGLAPLLRDWQALTTHQGGHPPADAPWDDPVPTPSLEDVVAEHVRRQSAEAAA